MRAASENLEWVNVLTVSERDDGASQQTIGTQNNLLLAEQKKLGRPLWRTRFRRVFQPRTGEAPAAHTFSKGFSASKMNPSNLSK